MSDFEKRGGLHGVEARATDEKRTLVGYAAIFNSDTTISDYFVERIAPGAFAETITGDIRALVDHDTGKVIGRTRSRTLRLSEDTRGLRVEIDIPNNTVGNDLWVSVERGDISGMSFGFRVTKQEWDESGDMPVRTIRGIELFEVSAVAFPAYDDTTLAKRSLEAARTDAGGLRNAAAAARRVAEKRASTEQRIRGIWHAS
ncbi:hypothetical protein BLJAPNOD_02950 [Ensifer sp. M14]|uniref:HK97 family phage prohead protease n=1 Tax=Ensifer sp. M14 TaxID=2203782 RepID=UPI000E1DA0D1|nr:HK97 family phage prohead protease [Ensifer sp. M14]RDL51809.1 hypothetical protein BLJAPNOD_02950 [Ensifer sp. M14]